MEGMCAARNDAPRDTKESHHRCGQGSERGEQSQQQVTRVVSAPPDSPGVKSVALAPRKLLSKRRAFDALEESPLGVKPCRPRAVVIRAVFGECSPEVPWFVGTRVMNDERRIDGRDSVDSIRQRVETLRDKGGSGCIEKVKQELFLGVDDLE